MTHCVKRVQIRSLFCAVFTRIRTEYRDLRSKSPYSIQIRVNTDQKKLRIWTLFAQWQWNPPWRGEVANQTKRLYPLRQRGELVKAAQLVSYRAICKVGVCYHGICKIRVCYRANCKVAVSYRAICTIGISYGAIWMIGIFYHAICRVGVCYRADCKIAVSYRAACRMVALYRAICGLGISYRAICRIGFFYVQFAK